MIIKSGYIYLLLLTVSHLGIMSFLGCSSARRNKPVSNIDHQILHISYVNRIRFSSDGKYLFSKGDLDGKIIMWDVALMQPERVLINQLGKYSVFETNPTGKTFAYSSDNSINIYDYENMKQAGLYQGSLGSIEKLLFSSDGRYLIAETSGSPGTKIWNIETGNIQFSLDWYQLLAIVPGNKSVVYWLGKNLAFFDMESGKEVRRLRVESSEQFNPHGPGVLQALFSSDGMRGFSLSGLGELSYFNVKTGEVTASIKPWKEQRIGVGKIILDESMGRLYGISMGYENFTVSIFDMEKGELQKVTKRTLPIPKDRDPNAGQEILDAVLSPDGKTLAIAGEDCQILLLDIETLETKGILGKGCKVEPFKRPGIL